MKITFLGTGTSQGTPTIGCHCEVCTSSDARDMRLRSSIFIEYKGINILVDTSPDLRQQMLAHNVKRIDGVLFTHEHNDHTAGLDDLRPYNFMQGGEMPIFGQERVIENLVERFGYAFTGGQYPGAPRMQPHIITPGEHFNFNDIAIQSIPVIHGKLPILGYRINNFAYVTDVSWISEESMQKLQDLDVLIISGLRIQEHHSHFNLDEAIEHIRILKPNRAYITHISHQLGLYKDVESQLPDKIHLSYDGLTIKMP